MKPKKIKSLFPAVILLAVFGVSSCTARTETGAGGDSSKSAAQTPATETKTVAETPAAETKIGEETSSAETTATGEEQTVPAPDAVIKDLYKTHGEDFKNGDDRILNGKNRKLLDKYFDKQFADLIWKDITANRDEVGVLDFDPFYNAQDAEIKNLVVGEPKIKGDRANVTVTFRNFDRRETITYELVLRDSAWKILDIKYADGSSLQGYFKEAARK